MGQRMFSECFQAICYGMAALQPREINVEKNRPGKVTISKTAWLNACTSFSKKNSEKNAFKVCIRFPSLQQRSEATIQNNSVVLN